MDGLFIEANVSNADAVKVMYERTIDDWGPEHLRQ
jgi:hypothetical protein